MLSGKQNGDYKAFLVKWALRVFSFSIGVAMVMQLSLSLYLPSSPFLQKASQSSLLGSSATGRKSTDRGLTSFNSTKKMLSRKDNRGSLPKLGVLLDTGRHEFALDWIYDLIEQMARLNLSILHIRLTDDQRMVDTNSSFWPKVARFAERRSIQILPEVDVPSHALAWDDLAVACPKIACEKAFGIPLNISHPRLWEKLTYLLQWTINTFHPSILHMGGDEIHVNGGACVAEATGARTQDYELFEQLLGDLLQSKFQFGPERIVRWERTDLHHKPTYRYGNHIHYWSSMPITTLKNAFVSTNLYWDVINNHDYEPDAFRIYSIGRRYREQRAIIAGTFELNAELWKDRNVMGKLVALALTPNEYDDRQAFERAYNVSCRSVLSDSVCNRMGRPLISNDVYRSKHAALWTNWRKKACAKHGETIDHTKRGDAIVKFG